MLESCGVPPKQQHREDQRRISVMGNTTQQQLLKVRDVENLDEEDMQELTLGQFAQVHKVKSILVAEE